MPNPTMSTVNVVIADDVRHPTKSAMTTANEVYVGQLLDLTIGTHTETFFVKYIKQGGTPDMTLFVETATKKQITEAQGLTWRGRRLWPDGQESRQVPIEAPDKSTYIAFAWIVLIGFTVGGLNWLVTKNTNSFFLCVALIATLYLAFLLITPVSLKAGNNIWRILLGLLMLNLVIGKFFK